MKKWNILSSAIPKSSDELIDILLLNRGIVSDSEKKEFLHPSLDTVNFETVNIDKKEVEKSKSRIEKAISNNEGIVIYGDYDVDGITGTAIMWETLYWGLGYRNVHPYIPHRVNEGYGITEKGIDNVLKDHPDVTVIITVDNGIVATQAIAYANTKGIAVIVTDHHTAGEMLPKAFSIIHTTKICGAAVAFLFALSLEAKGISGDDVRLDLVALATVADLVPLVGQNRVLLKYGLEVLRRSSRPGIRALARESGIRQENIGVYEIGHMLAPRLNAAGRLEHALDSLRLLCTRNTLRAEEYARNLSDVNRQRQDMTEKLVTLAKNSVIFEDSTKVIISHSEEYNQGVIGLIASRLTEKYYRPSLVISKGEELSKGSARSIKGVNIIELIRGASTYLTEAGGHPMAAGFSLYTKHLDLFIEEITKEADTVVDGSQFQRSLAIDCELEPYMISDDQYKNIQLLSPFGMSNYEPVFLTRKMKVESVKKIGKDGSHLKLKLSSGKIPLDAIGFGLASEDLVLEAGQNISIVYSLSSNEWNGKRSIQLVIKDYKTS